MKITHTKELTFQSHLYLILSKDSFSRETALKLLLEKIKGDVKNFEGSKMRIEDLLFECQSLSFFSEKKIMLIRNLDQLSKESLAQLEDVFSESVVFIMEAESINRATRLYKTVEKDGVLLDIPEEKPWEKEKSVLAWLSKKVSPEVADVMIKQLGADQSLLLQELEKLSLFALNRPITVADVAAVCAFVNTENVWKLGDALISRDAKGALKAGINLLEEGVSFFQLVRQVRSQFQTKYQVCSILSSGGGQAEVALQYPYMKGRILDQNCQMAHAYGMERFRRAMLHIDKTEAMAKSQTSDERILIERLIIGLV